jgi:4-carboxymuconolactone decarboxylase
MPETLEHFKAQYPKSWRAYEQLRNACDAEGPLDRKTVELIKIGISTALEHHGGLVAHISQARKAGATDNEINHAIIVAMGLAGFPTVLAASKTAREYPKP